MSEKDKLNISVVIPLYDEQDSLTELCGLIHESIKENNLGSYEIILIDDGSKDESWIVIEEEISKNPSVKGIKFKKKAKSSIGLETCIS